MSSVPDYPISEEEKMESAKLAQHVLTACNGKSSRIPLITAHRLFDYIADNAPSRSLALDIALCLEEIAHKIRVKAEARPV